MFTSTQKHGEERFIDLAPKGPSAGDRVALVHGRFAGSDDVRRAARGRLRVGEQGASPCSSAASSCSSPTAASSLQGAYAGKPIPGVGGTQEEYAVTGGTGAYQGATGTMRRDGNGKRDTLTVALAP